MGSFTAVPRRWGNSLGVTIPQDVAKEAGIAANEECEVIIMKRRKVDWRKEFGTLPRKCSMREAMRVVDEGEDD